MGQGAVTEPRIRFMPHMCAGHTVITPPRPLIHRERALLLFLLSESTPGRDELRRQAESVLVCGECTCGCGTVGLLEPERHEGWTSDRLPVAAEAFNFSDPTTPAQVLLHTTNGVLRELEIVW